MKETVIHGKTGFFFDSLTVESLKKTLQQFEKSKLDPKDCKKQAEKFAKERFIREIKAFVDSKVKAR